MNRGNSPNTTNNSTPNSASGIVTYLFKLQVAIKMFHWQTRSYAAHQDMGRLFDKIVELTDELIEQYMGVYGRVRMSANASISVPNMTKSGMRQQLRDGIKYLGSRLPRDPNLANIRDELTGEMAQALYVLSMR